MKYFGIKAGAEAVGKMKIFDVKMFIAEFCDGFPPQRSEL